MATLKDFARTGPVNSMAITPTAITKTTFENFILFSFHFQVNT
jgi:hypothetical protein